MHQSQSTRESEEQSEMAESAALAGDSTTQLPTSSGRRRQPAAVRKAQIVRAAQRLIGQYGLAGVSMKLIAGAIGISDAALYRHFDSREDILIAAYQNLTKRVLAWLHSGQASDVIDRLREIGEAHAGLLSADVEYFNAPQFQYTSWTQRDRVYDQVLQRRVRVRRWFIDLVEEGKKQGCINRSIDTDLIVAELLAWIWWEDLSYLQDPEAKLASKTSAAMFAGILRRISVPKAGPDLDDSEPTVPEDLAC